MQSIDDHGMPCVASGPVSNQSSTGSEASSRDESMSTSLAYVSEPFGNEASREGGNDSGTSPSIAGRTRRGNTGGGGDDGSRSIDALSDVRDERHRHAQPNTGGRARLAFVDTLSKKGTMLRSRTNSGTKRRILPIGRLMPAEAAAASRIFPSQAMTIR